MGRFGDMVIGGAVVAVIGGVGVFSAAKYGPDWIHPDRRVATLTQHVDSLQRELAALRATSDQQRFETGRGVQERDYLHAQIVEQKQLAENLRSTVTTLEADLRAAEGDRVRVAEVSRQLQAALDRAGAAEIAARSLTERLDEADRENKELKYVNDELAAVNRQLTDMLSSTRATLAESQSLSQSLTVQVRQTTAELQETKTSLEAAAARNEEFSRRIDDHEAQKQRQEEQRRLNRERLARWSRELSL